MQNKIFFTHAFFLLYGLATHAYAIDDISLPDRIRQEQRLKELNQQLEEQINPSTFYGDTTHNSLKIALPTNR